MDKFEKMAEQFECVGVLMTVPGYEETMEALTDEKLPIFAKMGKMMNLVGKCMKICPDTMKKIVAMDNDMSMEQVEALEEKELAPMMIKALSGETASFFGSASGQAGLV